MQLSPDLLAELPNHPAETAPRIVQLGHKQARLAPPIGTLHARGGAPVVVELHLRAWAEAQPVKLLGLLVPESCAEALEGVVGAIEAVQYHQVQVDHHGVGDRAQLQLDVDVGPVRLTARVRKGWCRWGVAGTEVIGHAGAVCVVTSKSTTDGLPIA